MFSNTPPLLLRRGLGAADILAVGTAVLAVFEVVVFNAAEVVLAAEEDEAIAPAAAAVRADLYQQ